MPHHQHDGAAKPAAAVRPPWAAVLLALRAARSVTQDGWAARLGVSRRTVQRWERGEWPPDAGAEAGILAYCEEKSLFRAFQRGPLADLNLTAGSLQTLLAEARMLAGRRNPAHTPPVTPDAARSSGLPARTSSFVGREQELTALRRALGGTRLLTLTGSGGCGKTRLALALAEELLWAYPHGLHFVELAPLTDPALVAPAVATALGLRPEGTQPVIDLLVEHLAPRHLLLILDNCEHLLGACAVLVETLLRACPHLEVLVTSRELLGIGGETLWRVPPMTVSVAGGQWSVIGEGLSADHRSPTTDHPDAVRLFVERARQYRPDFSLTAANEADVVRICERLDGIPLALELAAARIKVLSVEQIAARLADRFRLLTGGSRTALPRHQTLWAAMDWSHELLTPAEQALFRRLSVFAGGFTLEAVEAVGSGQWAMRSSGSPPPIADCRLPVASEHDVLDLLTSLVDKSLVIAEERDGAVRYRLLETVRQYAAEKLEEAGETEQARDRHLEWYLELAQTAETEIWTAGEPEWLTRLEQEHDNLRAALAWSLAEGAGRSPDRRGLGNRTEPALSRAKGSPIPNGERAMRLAGALPRFWERRGHLSEGRRWLAQALEAGEVASAEVRASALYGAGTLAYMQGDYAAARAACEQSLLLCQEAGNQQGAAEAQRTLGYIALRYGEYDAARASFEASLATHTELGCKPGIARARGGLGMLAYRQGDCDAARAHYEASLALHREFGHKDGIASTLDDLATVAGEQHAGAEQAALLEESLTLYREIGNRQGIALVLASLGMAAWARGEHDRAPALLKESLTLYREVGDQRGVARLLGHQSVVALYQRDYARAAVLCRESLALYQELGDRWTIARYLPVLAGAAFGQRQPVRAARLFGAAAAMRRSLSAALPPVVRQTHDRTVAAVHAVLGDGPFQAAWSEGQDASLEATIACALSDQEPA